MRHLRAIVMLGAAGLAFYRGCTIHGGREAYFAFGLGLVALGIAAWHLRAALPVRGGRAGRQSGRGLNGRRDSL